MRRLLILALLLCGTAAFAQSVMPGSRPRTDAFRATTYLANSLGADVILANDTLFYDGPSVAQGAVGTWFASGTVSLEDTSSAATFFCKLWDGTTTVASMTATSAAEVAYRDSLRLFAPRTFPPS